MKTEEDLKIVWSDFADLKWAWKLKITKNVVRVYNVYCTRSAYIYR